MRLAPSVSSDSCMHSSGARHVSISTSSIQSPTRTGQGTGRNQCCIPSAKSTVLHQPCGLFAQAGLDTWCSDTTIYSRIPTTQRGFPQRHQANSNQVDGTSKGANRRFAPPAGTCADLPRGGAASAWGTTVECSLFTSHIESPATRRRPRSAASHMDAATHNGGQRTVGTDQATTRRSTKEPRRSL